MEAAKVDYVAKIHKTLIDIQGQLLAIPVATIIVASQLKSNQTCGVDFWTNIAVLAGPGFSSPCSSSRLSISG